MKLKFVLAFLLFAFFNSPFTQVDNSYDRFEAVKQSVVYITKTGSKYHLGSCRYLHSSKIPLGKSDAINRGYTACSVCKPGGGASYYSQPQKSTGRCQATTKAGTQCKRSAQAGRNYCWQH